MRTVGELCLLTAFVASGFAAFACIAGERLRSANAIRVGIPSAVLSMMMLSVCMGVLTWALWAKDFSFDYVAKYSSRELESHYSLSALWVGQAGSLLLWAWMTNALVLVFRFTQRKRSKPLLDVAFGLGLGYVGFLVAIMVSAFAAPRDDDPPADCLRGLCRLNTLVRSGDGRAYHGPTQFGVCQCRATVGNHYVGTFGQWHSAGRQLGL
jgi:cytochrome c biogenesis factor